MEPNPSNPQQVGGILNRVHQLGVATEQLFSRLYKGLNNRQQAEQLALQQQAEKRNRQLRRMLKDSTMQVDRLQAILANISEGIILQDLDGRVLEMNQAARDLLGSERNLWHSEIVNLFTDFRDITTTDNELAPLGQPQRIQVQDRVIGTQLAAIADTKGERIGTLIILRDVTKDELSNRLRNSFVTHISHELRTPLAPMRLASEILLNSPQDKAPNRRMLELISRNVDILDRMVNEMIDISAMSSGTFEIRGDTIYLESLLYDIAEEFKDDLAEAKLEIQWIFKQVDALIVKGDEKFLRWSISNLFRNAVQYNEPNQQIIIRVGLQTNAPNPYIVLQIADTGVGISAEDLPNVFDLFFRGKPRTRAGKLIDPRGLGQGLYVARKIAEAHGGSLNVQSKLAEGSIFTMILPFSASVLNAEN
jgi:signal transduction histidine kinase